MTDNEKYFTPNITDIRVGYECEIIGESGITQTYFEQKGNGWHKYVLNSSQIHIIPFYIEKENVRVPYLTKEQIESEEWEFINYDKVLGIYEFKRVDGKSWYELSFYEGINNLIIEYWRDQDNDQQLFNGKCKCINELKTICKLLNI